MIETIYFLLFLLSLLVSIYVSTNFWPLLFLFLWIAIPTCLITVMLRINARIRKNKNKPRG